VSIYHEPGDDAPAAWAAVGMVGRCHDSIYHEESGDHIDGVLDISFIVPHRNLSGESTKEMSLDLEVSGSAASVDKRAQRKKYVSICTFVLVKQVN